MKIVLVVGARPNFMKAAPLVRAVTERNSRILTSLDQIDLLLLHTGQHYDRMMSEAFFSDLGLPKPNIHLGVGSGSHAVQTSEIMRAFEQVLLQERPDVLIVVGDVNSTLACALVAAKWPVSDRPLIAHVEAGLRSFDRSMPEEINRILVDKLSDLLFVTEESGLQNLIREGASPGQIYFVGNTMIDSLMAFKDKADASPILGLLGLVDETAYPAMKDYALLTLHRPANVDNHQTFAGILEGLSELVTKLPVIFPAHPRTHKQINDLGLVRYFSLSPGRSKGIRVVDPLGYIDFLCLMKNARIVITDSGGIQEETTCLGIPCVTVRESTERPVTVEKGTNVIAGTASERIRLAVEHQLITKRHRSVPEKWDGNAAGRIIDVLLNVARSKHDSMHASCVPA